MASYISSFFRKRKNSVSSKKNDKKEHEQSAVTCTRSLSMQSIERSRSNDSISTIASADMNFTTATGTLTTFAKTISCDRARKRSMVRSHKLIMVPYFGHYAGQRIVFDLKKTSEYSVNIKVRTEEKVIASLHHRQGKKKEHIKDQCIKFAHEVSPSAGTLHQPLALGFLCEQTIFLNLHELDYCQLPTRYRQQFNKKYLEVRIVVYPHHLCSRAMTMKVKPNLSVRELQWMLAKKLGIDATPSSIVLYVQDALEPLPSTAAIDSTLTDLVCVLPPSFLQTAPLSLCVSIIGRGIAEVQVHRSMTLFEFEQSIKRTFNLKPDSFLYLPQILSYSRHNTSQCPLRMHAILDSSNSNVLLLDHERRSFPTLYGHLAVSGQETLQSLLLYRMTIAEFDILKNGPVIGFEVTGPTIPIAFKTLNDINCTPGFSAISLKAHAVSINSTWSIPTLLKYLTCISDFPCNQITIDDRTLESTVASDILYCKWFNDSYVLPPYIPTATP